MKAQWEEVLEAFQVSSLCQAGTCEALLLSWTHSQLFALQAEGEKFTDELALWCQVVVLRLLLAGCYQPPHEAGNAEGVAQL